MHNYIVEYNARGVGKMITVRNPVMIMKRRELKFIIDPEQEEHLKRSLEGRMTPDDFGMTDVASLYYDTPDHRLIVTSMEKPPFKEKIRLRSYGRATDTSPVFLELKRKCESVVYKRRVQTTIPQAERFFAGSCDICAEGQINREITYFRDFYGDLAPACLIMCGRIAYRDTASDLRVTIDKGLRYRTEDLDLRAPLEGEPVLAPGHSILEIKVQQAMPLWLSRVLSEGEIYKQSFSKYGEAFKLQSANIHTGGLINV